MVDVVGRIIHASQIFVKTLLNEKQLFYDNSYNRVMAILLKLLYNHLDVF